mmetsp:Transcript_50215/g.160928  ORF Transcript_50215/g.160928 Transcript_50215/m.160928 type:complete len:286 (+) Transcript_50215:290-1147(+)
MHPYPRVPVEGHHTLPARGENHGGGALQRADWNYHAGPGCLEVENSRLEGRRINAGELERLHRHPGVRKVTLEASHVQVLHGARLSQEGHLAPPELVYQRHNGERYRIHRRDGSNEVARYVRALCRIDAADEQAAPSLHHQRGRVVRAAGSHHDHRRPCFHAPDGSVDGVQPVVVVGGLEALRRPRLDVRAELRRGAAGHGLQSRRAPRQGRAAAPLGLVEGKHTRCRCRQRLLIICHLHHQADLGGGHTRERILVVGARAGRADNLQPEQRACVDQRLHHVLAV